MKIGKCPECEEKTILEIGIKKVKPDFEKGFNILMGYFEWIPDEDKEEVSNRLDRVGL